MRDLIDFWNQKCAEFIQLSEMADKNYSHREKTKLIGNVCSTLPKNNCFESYSWFESCLKDDTKKWFAAEVFNKKASLPESLFDPFLKAAINEKNVSLNRNFLRPCVKTFGESEVKNRLLEYMESGTDLQKAGAEEVIYWVDKF